MVIILVTGGSRSGKSGFALSLAEDREGPRVFLATAQAFDEEMRDRIAAHRRPARRDGGSWRSRARCPKPCAARWAGRPDRADRLHHLWMSNLLLRRRGFGEARGGAGAPRSCAAARGSVLPRDHAAAVIIVTNEVGSGIVPDNALARRFRDCAGRANQLIAQAADEVYFLVSGIAMKIKPGKGRQ